MQNFSCSQSINTRTGVLFLFALLYILFIWPPYAHAQESELTLTMSGLRNSKGFVHISLYNQPKGFPSDPTTTFRNYSIAAKTPESTLTISNLKSGEYAIAIIHDENGNNLLDTNFAGVPTEGYGSSGANRKFGAPVFEKSRFVLSSGKMLINIKVNYLL